MASNVTWETCVSRLFFEWFHLWGCVMAFNVTWETHWVPPQLGSLKPTSWLHRSALTNRIDPKHFS